jgi:hypothetical protein
MAIPSLQRNSRNNQRKQDVAAILQSVSHWELNNSGNMPPDNSYLQSLRLSYYQLSNVTMHAQSLTGSTPAADVNPVSGTNALDKVDIYNYEKCSTTSSGGAVIQGAGFNDVVALYAVETGSAITPQCSQL